MSLYQYQVGGSLKNDDPHYVKRQADDTLYEALKNRQFCYILNARQMGKSSLLVRTKSRLEAEGYRCTTLDMTQIGSENITPLQWYKGMVTDLWQGFNFSSKFSIKNWWKDGEEFSFIQQLTRFLETVILAEFSQENMIILVDEIDTILNLQFSVDDFFAWIRYCYNQRAINSQYNRLSFAIFGVATPSDLIQDKRRTPFNVGIPIEMTGFKLSEVAPLIRGLEGKVTHPNQVLREILTWTDGQPFLTQKICHILEKKAKEHHPKIIEIPQGMEGYWIETIVKEHIINRWESQDEPEHLRTIRDRIEWNQERIGRLLGIYQKILETNGKGVTVDDSREQVELLLSGLVVKHNGFLIVKNPIYREIFNLDWVANKLSQLRPYSQLFEGWILSGKLDQSRLLRGQVLKEAQLWSLGKSLTDLDYQFLAASQECDRQEVQLQLEAERAKEVQAKLIEIHKNTELQKRFIMALTGGICVSFFLASISFFLYLQSVNNEKKAKINELQSLVKASQSLFASGQKLEALIEGIKADEKLHNLGKVNQELDTSIKSVLGQSVYQVQEINRLKGHTKGISGIAISPDGKMIATVSFDQTLKLWKSDGTLLTSILAHDDKIYTVDFSPDSQMLVSASDDKTIKLWRKDGTLIRTIFGHKDPLSQAIFSPFPLDSKDDYIIASASIDGTIKLWKTDGTLLKTIEDLGNPIIAIAFSPDGKMIASGGYDKNVKLWDREGNLLGVFEGHQENINGLAFSPDGQMLASCSNDKTIKLWSLSGDLLKTIDGKRDRITSVIFSPDGKMLASGSVDRTIRLWNLQGDELKTFTGHLNDVLKIAFSRDGNLLLSASMDQTARVWKVKESLFTVLRGHTNRVLDAVFDPQGKMLVSTGIDKTIKFWDLRGNPLKSFLAHDEFVLALAFSPDGKIIASGGHDHVIKLWSREGILRNIFPKDANVNIGTLEFSPDGKILASSGSDRTIKLWNLEGKLLKVIPAHQDVIRLISFSPDGNIIASASGDKTIKLWRLNGQEITTLKGHENEVMSIHFSPDGKILASAGADRMIKLWTIEGKLLKTIVADERVLFSVVFSPNGQMLASSGGEKTVKLWRLDGTKITQLSGHHDEVWRVVFSPDGKKLASMSADKTVILWEIEKHLNLDLGHYGCGLVRDYLQNYSLLSPESQSSSEENNTICQGKIKTLE